jgi:ABC transporter substrate binding protein
MRRREFIALLGSGVAAWPLAARAQQPGKLPTVGFLGQSTPLGESQRAAAFAQRLRELGWVEGRTIAIEYRWAEGRNDYLDEIAAEFVRLKVDVIVVSGTPAVMASKRATSTIPIVFATAGDPVGNRLVDSLARPGGNAPVIAFVPDPSDLTRSDYNDTRAFLNICELIAVGVNKGAFSKSVAEASADTAATAAGCGRTDTLSMRGSPRSRFPPKQCWRPGCGSSFFRRRLQNTVSARVFLGQCKGRGI